MIPRDPDTEPSVEDIEPDESEAMKQALVEEKKRAEEYLASWQRSQADFVNFKRRSEQEREETIKTANAELARSILPSIDDLNRALEHIDGATVDENWVEGISLIERKLRAGLESQGIREIQALGEKFDPNLHEAVMHSKGPEGIVVQELQKGYILYDKVIRPSMVVVGNGEKEPKDD